MQAIVDRDVAVRAPNYPEVDVRTVTAYGTFLSYLAEYLRRPGGLSRTCPRE
jgi:hypothetical protein